MIDSDKACSKCFQVFPATTEYFPPDKGTASGLRSMCRDCKRRADASRYKGSQPAVDTGLNALMDGAPMLETITDPVEAAACGFLNNNPGDEQIADIVARTGGVVEHSDARGAYISLPSHVGGARLPDTEGVGRMVISAAFEAAASIETGDLEIAPPAHGGLHQQLTARHNAGAAMHHIDVIEDVVRQTMIDLPDLDDAQIIELAIKARDMESAAYRIRGACAAEIQRRITVKAQAGRGVKDEAGVGIKAQMKKFADEIGVDPGTLWADLQIHNVFGSTEAYLNPALTREHFRAAVSAPDPVLAIEIAESKIGTPGYNTRAFREEVASLKSPDGVPRRNADDLGDEARARADGQSLDITYSQATIRGIKYLLKRWEERSMSSVIERLVREMVAEEKSNELYCTGIYGGVASPGGAPSRTGAGGG